jgi:hypothetical protein
MYFPVSNFNDSIYNRPIEEEKRIFFIGKATRDHIQITSAFNVYTLTIKTLVNNEWKTIFQKNYNGAVKILAIGNLLRDRRQQIVIGQYSLGSSATLQFEVLGWSNGTVKSLLSEFGPNTGYPFGEIQIKNNAVYLTSLTQGKIFIWNGKQFISYPFLNNPNSALISQSDIVIYYEISQEGKITSSIPINLVLTLKKGQRIFLIRGNLGPVERVLLDGKIFLSDFYSHPQIVTTTQSGKGAFTIIPNLYDWENAIRYQVEVLP